MYICFLLFFLLKASLQDFSHGCPVRTLSFKELKLTQCQSFGKCCQSYFSSYMGNYTSKSTEKTCHGFGKLVLGQFSHLWFAGQSPLIS